MVRWSTRRKQNPPEMSSSLAYALPESDVERVVAVPVVFRHRDVRSYSVKLHCGWCCDTAFRYGNLPKLLCTNHTSQLYACGRKGCERVWVKVPKGD